MFSFLRKKKPNRIIFLGETAKNGVVSCAQKSSRQSRQKIANKWSLDGEQCHIYSTRNEIGGKAVVNGKKMSLTRIMFAFDASSVTKPNRSESALRWITHLTSVTFVADNNQVDFPLPLAGDDHTTNRTDPPPALFSDITKHSQIGIVDLHSTTNKNPFVWFPSTVQISELFIIETMQAKMEWNILESVHWFVDCILWAWKCKNIPHWANIDRAEQLTRMCIFGRVKIHNTQTIFFNTLLDSVTRLVLVILFC